MLRGTLNKVSLRFSWNTTFTVQRSITSECTSRGHLPLGGIKVLDLTRVLAGPYCTMLLGDLGADIIKVEKPGIGDETRSWGPPFVGKETAYFVAINRNKKSVTIDMKKRDGIAIIHDLAKQCDVLVENFIPGKLSEMGIGYEQMKTVAPHLVYCSITGYGQTGPYSKRAGYDVVAAGTGGLMHITGPEDGEPCRVGVAMTDISTGLYAHGAIMAALIQRQKTGLGQHIDCNLLCSQVAILSHIASNYLNADVEARRYGTGHASIVPYQAFSTTDGHIIVGGGNNKMFKILCQCLDMESLWADSRYSSNQDRVQNRDSLIKTLSERFSQKSTDEWLKIFEGSGIPYGPINNMKEVFSNPQVKHANMIQEIEHSTAGHLKVPGPAVKFSTFDMDVHHAPPTLGQHTQDILKTLLNYSPSDIDRLRDDGVIG